MGRLEVETAEEGMLSLALSLSLPSLLSLSRSGGGGVPLRSDYVDAGDGDSMA